MHGFEWRVKKVDFEKEFNFLNITSSISELKSDFQHWKSYLYSALILTFIKSTPNQFGNSSHTIALTIILVLLSNTKWNRL